MKLTPWYPASVKPVREGLYECEECAEKFGDGKHLWRDKAWWSDEKSGYKIVGGFKWRGLAKKPR